MRRPFNVKQFGLFKGSCFSLARIAACFLAGEERSQGRAFWARCDSGRSVAEGLYCGPQLALSSLAGQEKNKKCSFQETLPPYTAGCRH